MLSYPMAIMTNEEKGIEEKVEQDINNQQLEEESFGSIVPTLIAIGDSPVADVEIQRHIVRALDNLSTEGMISQKYFLFSFFFFNHCQLHTNILLFYFILFYFILKKPPTE